MLCTAEAIEGVKRIGGIYKQIVSSCLNSKSTACTAASIWPAQNEPATSWISSPVTNRMGLVMICLAVFQIPMGRIQPGSCSR